MASPVGNGHDFNKFLDLDDDHRHLARELAAAFLHTVFFCRSLGTSPLVEGEEGNLNVSYLVCGETDVHGQIEEAVDAFAAAVGKIEGGGEGGHAVVVADFYEVVKSGYLFARTTESEFERWSLSVRLRSAAETDALGLTSQERKELLEDELRDLLTGIVSDVNVRKSHLPEPITRKDGSQGWHSKVYVPKDASGLWGFFQKVIS